MRGVSVCVDAGVCLRDGYVQDLVCMEDPMVQGSVCGGVPVYQLGLMCTDEELVWAESPL